MKIEIKIKKKRTKYTNSQRIRKFLSTRNIANFRLKACFKTIDRKQFSYNVEYVFSLYIFTSGLASLNWAK